MIQLQKIGKGPMLDLRIDQYSFTERTQRKKIALDVQKEIELAKVWRNPIVSELIELKRFTKAEDYHQDFIKNNPNQSYVRNVSMPRFYEFQKRYMDYKKSISR